MCQSLANCVNGFDFCRRQQSKLETFLISFKQRKAKQSMCEYVCKNKDTVTLT